jgi:hypothetical protein
MTQRFFREVLCPGCKIKISVKMILSRRDDVRRMGMVVYHCPQCDVETIRHFILSAGPSGRDNAGCIHLMKSYRTALEGRLPGACGSSCRASFARGDRLHETKLIGSRCRSSGPRIWFIPVIHALSKV